MACHVVLRRVVSYVACRLVLPLLGHLIVVCCDLQDARHRVEMEPLRLSPRSHRHHRRGLQWTNRCPGRGRGPGAASAERRARGPSGESERRERVRPSLREARRPLRRRPAEGSRSGCGPDGVARVRRGFVELATRRGRKPAEIKGKTSLRPFRPPTSCGRRMRARPPWLSASSACSASSGSSAS